jgi:hypothetical protein
MKCWSCTKPIPTAAQRCPHCEAVVEPEPTAEEEAAVMEMLGELDPSMIGEIAKVFNQSSSGEDFVNQIMVGPCPKCGSSSTGDCENDPEIEDPCIGRCAECGQLWCCDCEDLFAAVVDAAIHDCPVWQEMENEFGELQ